MIFRWVSEDPLWSAAAPSQPGTSELESEEGGKQCPAASSHSAPSRQRGGDRLQGKVRVAGGVQRPRRARGGFPRSIRGSSVVMKEPGGKKNRRKATSTG